MTSQKNLTDGYRPKPYMAICPCCQRPCNLSCDTKLEKMYSQLPANLRMHSVENLYQNIVQAQLGHSHTHPPIDYWWSHWACNDCLHQGVAVSADLSQQTFGQHAPFYAYYDTQGFCTDCGKPFVFTAREQKYWYETLKFRVNSRPKQCLSCRRQRRRMRLIKKLLDEKLGGYDPNNPVNLLEIAILYRKCGITKKADLYYRRSRNHITHVLNLDEWKSLNRIYASLLT